MSSGSFDLFSINRLFGYTSSDLCFRPEKMGGSDGVRKGGIWKRLWRMGSRGSHVSPSEVSDTSSVADVYHAAVAAVVRAPPVEFMALRRQWAAIRIQTAFRGFLVNI